MSALAAIRSALETALNGVTAIPLALENVAYKPIPGTPYAQVTLLPATPANLELSGAGYLESGIFQVNLFYPKNAGSKAALAQAEAIRAAFPFAASFVNGAVTVNVMQTPEIGVARPDGDRFMVPVKIRWQAWIS